MDKGRIAAGLVLVGGAWFYLTRRGDLAGSGLALDELGLVRHEPTEAERLRALAVRQPAAGNAPVSSNPSFVQQGGLLAIGGASTAVLASILGPGLVLGISTAGIGLAVAFISYELMKQRASMHTNDVRDSWTRQFIDLHSALGIRQLTYDQTAGSGPGSIEMAEVIFFFDHDGNNTLWKAVTQTQDERTFRYAAGRVDAFLRAQGVPVQDVS